MRRLPRAPLASVLGACLILCTGTAVVQSRVPGRDRAKEEHPKMRRPWLIALGVLLLLLLIVTFLNCGRAVAMPEREQVRRNKVATSYVITNQQQLQTAQAVDCKRTDATYAFENYLGNRLFSLTLIGRWCYEDGRVRSHRWNVDHHIGNYWWSNWRWEGLDTPIDTGGNGMRYVFRRVRGTFAVNILWFERNVTPFVQCTLQGAGDSDCANGD